MAKYLNDENNHFAIIELPNYDSQNKGTWTHRKDIQTSQVTDGACYDPENKSDHLQIHIENEQDADSGVINPETENRHVSDGGVLSNSRLQSSLNQISIK